MKLREFNLTDLLFICRNLPDDERAVYEALTGDDFIPDDVAASAFRYPGMHWVVATEHDIPVVAGGFIRQRPGVFRTWFFATRTAWQQSTDLTTLVKGIIQRVLAEKLAHRVETVTLAKRLRAQAWYEHIGLEKESTLRGYTAAGEDAVMYVATSGVKT